MRSRFLVTYYNSRGFHVIETQTLAAAEIMAEWLEKQIGVFKLFDPPIIIDDSIDRE